MILEGLVVDIIFMDHTPSSTVLKNKEMLSETPHLPPTLPNVNLSGSIKIQALDLKNEIKEN